MPRPDEGLIHAWLDGQLPPDEAARVEQLAAADPEWAAAVAEARGLIAASSRILASLDHAPSGVIPERKNIQPVWRLPWWAKIAAAIVVVAGGSMLVTQRANPPEFATVPAAKPTNGTTSGQPTAPRAAAPVAATAAPAEKKSPAAAASRAVDAAAKSKESAVAPALAANAQAVETRQKPGLADRPAPAAPPPLPAKDVAMKASDATQQLAVPAATATVGGIAAMRTAAGATTPTRAAEPAVAELQARRVSGGVAAPVQAKAALRDSRCYRVREPTASADAGVVMRLASTDGDTLRLESAQGASGLRAWIIWRDSLGHGAMTAADGKGAIAIVATTAACPAP